MAVDKFLSLGVLTITTHHAVHYVLYPSHRSPKHLGVLQHPQAPTVMFISREKLMTTLSNVLSRVNNAQIATYIIISKTMSIVSNVLYMG